MLMAHAGLDGSLLGLEELLMADPGDMFLHRTHANLLLRHPDPAFSNRGRLIEAQLKLEERTYRTDEGPKLERRVRKLVKDHGRVWLGPLAPYLLDGQGLEQRQSYRFEMVRGWLGKVVAPVLNGEFLEVLATAPQAGLLHTLIIESAGSGRPADLAPLLGASFLSHLQVFWLDPQAGPEGREIVEDLVRQMPRVRELCTPWHRD